MRIALPLLLISSTSLALPPNAPHDLRPGANHHTGDDGFVATEGRAPKPGEEKLRMHDHFVAVRARLAAAKATKPELEAMRQKLLADLDAYIAHGTTPDNEHLPWRTPVFIDDAGTICAVGYLIEQSAGHALAEKIASTHRYSFIEDIATDMPEVRAWVEQSGFTLEELGQIQPGYMGPEAVQWRAETVADSEHADGAYSEGGLTGAIAKRHMEGSWERRVDGKLVGSGQFHRGKGTWTSYYPSGAKLAEGAYKHDAPTGTWRFYHESGNLAAEGTLQDGVRYGRWRFYYDTSAKTPIAIGRFDEAAYVSGTWKHYDTTGRLIATSRGDDVPDGWDRDGDHLFPPTSFSLDILPDADRIEHHMHEGAISGDTHRLDELSRDGERIYLRFDTGTVFDADGFRLVAVDGGFRADDCGWSKARKRIAKDGDLTRLHGLIWSDADQCKEGKLIPQKRAERVAALVDSMGEVEQVSPSDIQKLALEQMSSEQLTRMVAANMSWDIEWPHVDGRFIEVYKTLPGLRGRY